MFSDLSLCISFLYYMTAQLQTVERLVIVRLFVTQSIDNARGQNKEVYRGQF